MLQILHVAAIGKFKLRPSLKQAIFFTLSVGDMVYSTYKKQRILYHRFKGLKAPTIAKILVEYVQSFLKRYRETGTIGRWPSTGRPSVISEDVKEIVEAQMHEMWRLKCRQVLNFKVPCY